VRTCSGLGMATRRGRDEFRYPILIPIEKIHHHPNTRPKEYQTFVSSPSQRVYTCTHTHTSFLIVLILINYFL